MSEEEKPGRSAIGRVALVLLLLLTPFIPLILSFAEHVTLKTNQVESFFRRIGVHDELSLLYEPVMDFLGVF